MQLFNNRTAAIAGVIGVTLVELANISLAPLIGERAGKVTHVVLLILCALLSAVARNPMGPSKTEERAQALDRGVCEHCQRHVS